MLTSFVRKLETRGRLSEQDRQLLSDVEVQTKLYSARRDVVREGEKPEHVNLITEGWACRYKTLPDGSRQITAFLVPGDFCDLHVVLLREMDHSIATIGPARVATISRRSVDELMDHPSIARALLWATLVDEAVLRAWIVNLGRRDAFERTAHMICEMHARLRNVGLADEATFDMPLTQEELADSLGLTSVHVNRVLKRLRTEDLIAFKRQQLVILDVSRLRQLAQFDANYLHFSLATEPK